MKKTLKEISDKITSVAFNLREDAGYSGSWTDGGASVLEDSLSMFINGVKAALTTAGVIDENSYGDGAEDYQFEVPKQWTKYFIEDDKEYKEYLRLKNKFERELNER